MYNWAVVPWKVELDKEAAIERQLKATCEAPFSKRLRCVGDGGDLCCNLKEPHAQGSTVYILLLNLSPPVANTAFLSVIKPDRHGNGRLRTAMPCAAME